MPSREVQVWKYWQSWGREGLIHQGPRPVHGSWSRRMCVCFLLGEKCQEMRKHCRVRKILERVSHVSCISVVTWNAKYSGFQWWGRLLLFKLRFSFDGILSSVWFSRSVVSDFLRPRELQHTRPPCPSPTPGVYPNPCPSSWWYHPNISSSVVHFSSCPQSLPASGSFQMSQLFTSGSQSIGVAASKSVLPMNTQDWSPLGWTGWISLQSKGLSRVFSITIVQKHQFFGAQLSL